MTTLAFVVLAHKGPQQLHRLLDRLAENNPVYLHIDSAVPASLHAQLTFPHENTRLVERKRSMWGSWGILEAELAGIRQALGEGATHVAVLTGQDYPIRPIAELEQLLEDNPDTTYLFHRKLPHSIYGKDGGLGRFYFWNKRIFGKRVRIPIRRKPPIALQPHSGFQLFVMHAELARWIVDFADSNPKVCAFFKHSWISDELFIATVMQESPFSHQVRNELLWHSQWEPGAAHPKILTKDDLAAIQESKMYFARKFDLHLDREIFDLLDAEMAIKS